MSSILWKTFNVVFSKLSCFPTAIDEQRSPHHKLLPDSSSIFQNFNSLYDANYSDVSPSISFADDFSDDDGGSVPDFSSAFASDRLFFSSPGGSNSIITEALETPPPTQNSGALVSGGVALQTYSPDPYADFRKSMVEMIESRGLKNVREDWEILHELLLCYLKLNPKHTHKFIVRAFADVVVSLVAAAAAPDGSDPA